MSHSISSYHIQHSIQSINQIKHNTSSQDNHIEIISDNLISALKLKSKSNNCKLTIKSKHDNAYAINSEIKAICFKENLKNKENLMLSDHKKSSVSQRNRFILNFHNRTQMTPNLRKHFNFKKNLYSQNKKRSSTNSMIKIKHNKMGLFQKKLKSKEISEFQISSHNKKVVKADNNTKRSGLRKLSKELFKIQKTKKIKKIKWKKKKKADQRFFKQSYNIDQISYHLTLQKEHNEIILNKKNKKNRTPKNSFLADALTKLTYNSKLILKNNLRLFYKNLRSQFRMEKPNANKKGSVVNYKHKITFSDIKDTQSSKNMVKIRKVSESPCKVLDAPGIIDDFYTHTQEVSSKGILFISLNNIVYSFNLANNKTQKIKTSFENSPSSIKVNQSGNQVAIGDNRGHLNLIDIQKNCYLFKSKVHRGRLGVIDYLNPHVLITGGKDSCLNIIDLRIKSHNISTYENTKLN